MSHDEHVYKQALLSSSSLDHDNESDSTMHDEKIAALDDYERKAARTRKIRAGALLSSVILNLVLLISLGALYARLQSTVVWRGVKPVWTPVNDIVSHVYVRYPDVHDISIYHGPPTDEVDRAWEDLYTWGISAIPKEDAAKLPGRTIPYAADPSHYIVEMDVFHQLHCLNTLRKSLYPERYPHNNVTFATGISDLEHLDHCINSIRENLMCTADTTPNRWDWDVPLQVSDPHFNMVHTCKDWDSIHEWAVENTAKVKFDKWKLVEDDLVYPKVPFENVIQRY